MERIMQTTSSLRDIHQGMKVFDASNREIGKVDWVKFGDDDPETPQPEASGISPIEEARRDGLMENIADAFQLDDVPEEVREKLLHQGFVRIDVEGLFDADRYVVPEQIASVTGDALTLKVSKDELLKRH
jgi:hypothetical protein